MEKEKINPKKTKYLLRKSVLGGVECPHYNTHTETIKNKNGQDKVYCDRHECPYNNLKSFNIDSMDLNFNQCESGGLVEKISF